jgi:ribosomal protein L31E
VLYWYQLEDQMIVAQFGATSINREVWKQSIRPPVLKIMLQTASSREDVAEERLRSIAAALRTSLKRPL